MLLKQTGSLIALSFAFFSLSAQSLPGYQTGNYQGVTSVFSNPAFIADNRYRWDVNLFGASLDILNSQRQLDFSTLGDIYNNENIYGQLIDPDAAKNRGMGTITVNGPSFMFTVGKKAAVAISSRYRLMQNVDDINGQFYQQVSRQLDETAYPFDFSQQSPMAFKTNTWIDFGASYAQRVLEKGKHYLKAGATIRYNAGVLSESWNAKNISYHAEYDQDYLSSRLSSGTAALSFYSGGVQIVDDETVKLAGSQGVSLDLGVAYEFRPAAGTATGENGSVRRDLNQYKFRVAVSVLDLGKIRYTTDVRATGNFAMQIPSNEDFLLPDFDFTNSSEFLDTLRSRPDYFTETGASGAARKVSLPATMLIDLDYHVHRNFFINTRARMSLIKLDTDNTAPRYTNSLLFTPRFEGRSFAVYVPLSFDEVADFSAGAALKLGPLYLGSGSILSVLFGSSKKVDGFIGLHFGSMQKRTVKTKSESGPAGTSGD